MSRRLLTVVFALLAAAQTWPLLPRAASYTLDDTDAVLNTWLLAAVTRAITTHPLTFLDINTYYPYRHALTTLDHQLGAAIFAGPVYLVTGNPQLAVNLYTFATFVAGGVFCALLVEELSGSAWAGLIAGSLFTFSSGRMENMNHSHVLGNCWLPLALLLMHRYVAQPTWRRLLAAIGVALLLALTAWYNAALGPLAIAVVALAGLLRHRATAFVAIRRLAAGSCLAAALIGAIAWPYARAQRDFRSPPGRTADVPGATVVDVAAHRTISTTTIQDNSTGLEGFVGAREAAPAPWLSRLRNVGLVGGRFFPGAAGAALALAAVALLFTAQARASWFAWPALILGAVFLAAVLSLAAHRPMGWPLVAVRQPGFFAVAIAAFVAWLFLRLAPSDPFPWLYDARTYFVLALVGGALSLGVVVYLDGAYIATGIYPASAPGFSLLRAPVRFGVLCALGTAVLAGFGFAAVTRSIAPRGRAAAGAAVLLLVNVELFAPLPRMRHIPRLPGVYAWLRRAPRGPVVELPVHANLIGLYWSLFHNQPLVQGYGLVEPPVYSRLVDEDVLSPEMVEHIRAHFHARYIAVDRTRYTGDADAALTANIARNGEDLKRVAAGDGREIYEIGGPSRGAPVLRAYRPWMVAQAHGVMVDAEIEPVRAGAAHVVQVWGNGRLLASAPWQPGMPHQRIFAPLPPHLPDGLNVEVLGDYVTAPPEIAIDAQLRTSRLQIGGHVWACSKGYTLAVVRPDGTVDEVRGFNTSWDEAASHALAERIAAIPQGWTAAVVTNYDASRALTADAVEALHTLGMTTDLRGRFLVNHAAIGRRGAAPGTAVEQASADGAHVATGTPAQVPVVVREVRIH